MEIQILQLLEGAREARGLTVIIDVFRAFSTACYAAETGLGPIYPVGTLEEAFRMKKILGDALLVGERNEQRPEGFDLGNSPALLLKSGFRDKAMIHTTSSGTQGIVNALHATEIITGSFVNAGAIARYIMKQNPSHVSLVCMGYACQYPTDEDTLCAEYIRNLLTGQSSDWEAMKAQIRNGSGARFFEKSSQQWAPEEDFDLCLDPDRFDFVLKVTQKEGLTCLEKIVQRRTAVRLFDEIVDRRGTDSFKYDALKMIFGSEDLLPLWVADTDFRTPDFIMEAIRSRMEHEILGYTFRGEGFSKSIINWISAHYGSPIPKGWISFTPGVVSAVTVAVMAFTQPGDKVVVQPPVYFPFYESITGSGREVTLNPLKLKEGRYHFDLEDLEAKIDSHTTMLILCSPHNPGGMVWKREELEVLAEICHRHRIMVVSDEIHSDLIFSGHRHTPWWMVSEEAARHAIVCMAPSKTFNIAGLSTSFTVIPDPEIRKKFDALVQTLHIGTGNIPGTVALEAAYTHGHEWLSQMMAYVEENYSFLEQFMAARLPRVKVMKPEATFLVWLDFREYGMDDRQLSEFLVREAKIALNNGARFGAGGDGWQRINIGCPRSVLKEGLERMALAFGRIKD